MPDLAASAQSDNAGGGPADPSPQRTDAHMHGVEVAEAAYVAAAEQAQAAAMAHDEQEGRKAGLL